MSTVIVRKDPSERREQGEPRALSDELARPVPLGDGVRSSRLTDAAPASPSSAGAVRVAIVDTDSGLLTALANRLDRVAWKHRILAAPPAPARIASMEVSALIVDPAIIGPTRWTWLERCCRVRGGAGIVVCTAQSTLAERIRGLRLGVDDWLSKPCHPEELVARVEAVLRPRQQAGASEDKPVAVGALEIRDQHQAFAGGSRLSLTRREFRLLELFARTTGVVLERGLIYERVWGYPMLSGHDRSVDVFVYKLRQKLEDASPQWRYIHTHWGVGYRFSPEPIEPKAARRAA